MKFFISIILSVSYLSNIFAQEYEPEDFFPFHLGDVWEYYTPNLYNDFEMRKLTRDSVATEGHYLFFDNTTIYNQPQYLVDTNLIVYSDPFNDKPRLSAAIYVLDADSGDTWLSYVDTSRSSQGRAVVRDTYWSIVLGKLTMVKEIDYYGQQLGDTSLWGSYTNTDHIAAGVGFIFQVGEAAEWPDYIISGAVINGDTIGTVTSVPTHENYLIKPRSPVLRGNYPNPFNPVTTIVFDLFKNENIELSIYNLLGQLVQTVAQGSFAKGRHEIKFNAEGLSSGQYIYKLKSDNKIQTGKMVLIK